MKKLIAVVLVLCIVFSMFSIAAISTAAATAEDDASASSDTVGTPEDADEYLNISLGETATGTAVVKRKFTPAKNMILKVTVTTSVSNIYEDVRTDNDTLEYYTYKEYDGFTEYFYGLKANETVYIGFGTYRFQNTWSEPSESQMVDISIKPEECTEWTEITMDKTAEYDYPNSKERYYFYFVAPEDMYAHVNYVSDGRTTVWFRNARGSSPTERYFYASGTNKNSTLCRFTAGDIYMMMCEYSPGYREQSAAGKMRVWLEKTEAISLGETKQLSFSDTTYAKTMIFTPENDSFIKYTPVSVSGNDNKYLSSLSSLSGDSEASASTESTEPIIARVTAGETYLFAGMFEDLGSGNSEVKLEEYSPRDIAVNEVVNAQIGYGNKDYFKLVPEKDTDVIFKSYNSRISLKNADMKNVTPLNGIYSSFYFCRLVKGETYYILATGASAPLEFCINEIVPKTISLNESNPSPGTDDGQYYFYEFTPDEDMAASVYFPKDTNNYSVTLYSSDWEYLSDSRKLTRDDYSYNLDKLTKEYAGKEEYYLLSKGNTYIFALYSSLSYWGGSKNLTPDFKLKPIEFKDIALNEYQSLYTHVSNEYLFFRYTPEETGFIKSELTQDEEDTRSIELSLLNSDFSTASNTISKNSMLVKKDKTYYLLGKTAFDLYCDDLDCGATLVNSEIKTIKEGETLEMDYGEIACFSPDKTMFVNYYADWSSKFELLDNAFNLIESDISEIRKDNQLVSAGEIYYFRNNYNSTSTKELSIRLVCYPETLTVNEERVITIDDTTTRQYFLFTPETDMTVEYYGYNPNDQGYSDIRPYGEVWNDSFSSYSSYNDYDSFSTLIEAAAGIPILLSTRLSSYGDSTGSYMIGLKNDSTIALNETRKFNSNDEHSAEKTFAFTPDDDMLVKFTAASNYVHVISASVQITDADGTVLAKGESEEDAFNMEASVMLQAEKDKTYYITASFESDGEYSFSGKLSVIGLRDLHLGDAITENGTYRFVPDKDVYPVIRVTTDDNTVFYDSVTVMNEDFDYLRPRNHFGGGYFAVRKGNTYFIDPPSDFRDWISEGYDVEFCEPETIEVGETKSAFVPDQSDWLYQISCDEPTMVKFTGTGGNVIAFLRDSYGNVLRSNVSGDDALFSFGYPLDAGEKYLIVISAYDDSDIQVTAAVPDEFEIVDNVLVKYYGNKANPSIPNVKAIGDSAFLYSDYLETLVIPDSVTEIGDASFARCYALTKAVVPGSVSVIGPRAFDFDVELNDLTLGEGITEIGEGAFAACLKLSEVTLPQSLTKIDNTAFLGCGALNEITIPKSVTYIGINALGYTEGYNGLSKKDSFIIRGYKDTAAEQYALDNGFTFIDLENGDIPEPGVTIGDVTGDGKVDITDATVIQKAVAELIELTDEQKKAADTNADGKIDITDATMIQKFVAELIDHLG